MPTHLFDTGFLTATGIQRAPLSAAALGQVGAPTAIGGNTPANAIDGSRATTMSLRVADGTNYHFLRIDLGSAQSVSLVRVRDVTSSGFAANLTMTCYVSNTASLSNPTTGSALAAAQVIPGEPITFDGSAAAVTGRYIYLCPNYTVPAGPGITLLSEVEVYITQSFSFAVLKQISVSAQFASTPLPTTAWQSRFPIDAGFHSGAIVLDAKHAEIENGALAAALGCDPISGVSWATLKPIAPTTQLPALSGLFEGTTSSGKRMRLRVPRLYCPGAKLDFALGQFATEGAQFMANLDPTSALVASWEFEN